MIISLTFILEMLGIGVILGLITMIFFFGTATKRAIKADWEKYNAARHDLRNKVRATVAAKKQRGKAAQPARVELTSRQAAILAEQMAIVGYIERAVTWLYISWHRIGSWERFLLCIPFGGAFIYVLFKMADPVFLSAASFEPLWPLKYIAQFIVVFGMHTIIYLIMSRYRLQISLAVAVVASIISPFCIWLMAPNFVESNLPEIFTIAGFHFFAILFLRWTWFVIDNAAGATLKLLGFEFIGIGLCTAVAVIYMIFTVPALAQQSSPEAVLGLPIYHALGPFMQSIMAPLHLHLGDLIPENATLIILLFLWAGILFYLGFYMVVANFAILEDVHKAPKIYS